MRERKFVKLRVDMHEDTKFKIIDRMEHRDLIHYIWIRLIALAGKVNHNFSKDIITDKALNMNDVNKINCIDKTVNNSKTYTKGIQVGNNELNVSEAAGKNINKSKRKNNIATNEINNIDDDNEEVIELQSGEKQCVKGERIVSNFSF